MVPLLHKIWWKSLIMSYMPDSKYLLTFLALYFDFGKHCTKYLRLMSYVVLTTLRSQSLLVSQSRKEWSWAYSCRQWKKRFHNCFTNSFSPFVSIGFLFQLLSEVHQLFLPILESTGNTQSRLIYLTRFTGWRLWISLV